MYFWSNGMMQVLNLNKSCDSNVFKIIYGHIKRVFLLREACEQYPAVDKSLKLPPIGDTIQKEPESRIYLRIWKD